MGLIVIIDSHMHANFMGLRTEDIIRYMDGNRIESCWLLTWEEKNPAIPSVYRHLSVEDVMEAYRRYPDRITPMYAPDPMDPQAPDRFKFWVEKGIRGCGELKVCLSWQSSSLDRLLDCVNELQMPLVFHMGERRDVYIADTDSVVDRWMARLLATDKLRGIPRRLLKAVAFFCPPLKRKSERFRHPFPGYLTNFEALEDRLRTYPKISFVGHGPLFWAGISEVRPAGRIYPRGRVGRSGITCRLLSEYANLFGDISGRAGFNALTRDRTFMKKFLSGHENKLLFGTDNYVHLGHRKILDALGLSKSACDLIYHGNAARVLNGSTRHPHVRSSSSKRDTLPNA